MMKNVLQYVEYDWCVFVEDLGECFFVFVGGVMSKFDVLRRGLYVVECCGFVEVSMQ